MWEETVLTDLKKCSELHQEKYVPPTRIRIIQPQTSALQLSLVKNFAVIRSKDVPSLSWFGVVTKMTFGPGETDMGAICCRQLCTAIINVLEQSKKAFFKSLSPDKKNI